MQELTNEWRRTTKDHLSVWQTSAEFRDHWTALTAGICCETYFNQGGLAFLRDAWDALQLATLRDDVAAVRLVPEPADRPDFELRLMDNQIRAYECVEADEKDCRRGDEYRALAAAGCPIVHVPSEQWATAAQAHDRLRAMAQKKADRAAKLAQAGTPYPPATGLVINLNLQDYGANNAEILATFSGAVTPARRSFSEIWVLWKGAAHLV